MKRRIKEINDYISHFKDADVERIYEYTLELAQLNSFPCDRPSCPRCSSEKVIKWGFRHEKQRFKCKECKETFMQTTNTIMSHSHFDRKTWHDFIEDTLEGKSLDESAERFGFTHQTAFNMRHKLLLALSEAAEMKPDQLAEVSELDETYVLDCYKGKPVPENIGREARKHGAKSAKRGLSNEQVCICAGVQRHGGAFAYTVNRAKPSIDELKEVFENHIASGSLLLVDGLRGYDSLESFTECSVKNVNTEGNKTMYNLNVVNNFHSFIKDRYDAYRGVATKYLNRYNALFRCAYRNTQEAVSRIFAVLCNVSATKHWKTVRCTRTEALLLI